MWQRTNTIVTILVLMSCASGVPTNPAGHGGIIFYAGYVSGGEWPMTESMAFFSDGTVRLRRTGEDPVWRRMTAPDVKVVSHLAGIATQIEPQLPSEWQCCDISHLSIDSRKAIDMIDKIEPKHVIVEPDHVDTLGENAAQVVREVDVLGRRYFGRRYRQIGQSHERRPDSR